MLSRSSSRLSAPTTASTANLKKTPLNAFAISHSGKMVDYAGWHMAVWYSKDGMMAEHKHCRKSALLFDVSHMKQFVFRGKDALKFIEWSSPADLQILPVGKGRLTWVPNEKCGIVDDCIMHRRSEFDEVGVVVNAGCADKDEAHFRNLIKESKMGDVDLTVHHERALLALQGPRAAEAMSKFIDYSVLNKIDFMDQVQLTCKELLGTDDKFYLTRCGYTGEDGFELSIPNECAEAVSDRILKSLDNSNNEGVWLGGLGCRDTLRLEGGMCLYGAEMAEDIDPIECGLMWQLTKRRREKMLKGEDYFFGCDALKELLKSPPSRRRVGIVSKGPCARDHSNEICDNDGNKIGYVTSGSPSPGLGGNMHQAFVKDGFHKNGTEIQLMVRNKKVPGQVTKLPFVEGKYYRAPK